MGCLRGNVSYSNSENTLVTLPVQKPSGISVAHVHCVSTIVSLQNWHIIPANLV